jgi:D-alanine-D-alanine ligase
MTNKIRIGVLFGGQSGEHEVSITSAHAVIAALDREKYDVVPIGITKQGRWLAGDNAFPALEAMADPKLLPGGPPARTTQRVPDQEPRTAALISHESVIEASGLTIGPRSSVLGSIDVIFPVLHGPMGEDGTVQGLMELAGVPYVGCGVLASSVGMDKAMMKAAFAAARFQLLPWLLVRRADWEREGEHTIAEIEARLRYPMFVKPANMGSSVGITKASERASLERGIAEAARYDRRIVVEQGINAREIEVSILGNDDVLASVPGEVVPSNEWYDYQAKYLGGESRILIPAPIAPALAEQAREMAIRAFKSIDGAGLARVDFLLDRETETLYLNELNTMPGFTSVSMYAKMWDATGLSYSELLDRLIELALERHSKQ